MNIVIEDQIINNGKKTNFYNFYYVTSDGKRISGTFQASIDRIKERIKDLKGFKK